MTDNCFNDDGDPRGLMDPAVRQHLITEIEALAIRAPSEARPSGSAAPGPPHPTPHTPHPRWVLPCLGCGLLIQIPEPRPAAACNACAAHLDDGTVAMINRAIEVGRQQQAALGESVHAADQAIIVHLARCHDAARIEARVLNYVLAGAASTSVVAAGLALAAWLAWRWLCP